VGFIIANIKAIEDAKVGETVTHVHRPAAEPLPGFKEVQPVVFAGIFPTDTKDYSELKDALGKLALNDAALSFDPETSQALGFGFRCGFLSLLHMDVVQERLEREFDLDLITTAPTVVYKCRLRDNTELDIDNPSKLPDRTHIDEIKEPYIRT